MRNYNASLFRALGKEEIVRLEKNHRVSKFYEELPQAIGASFDELALKSGHENDKWARPFFYMVTTHRTSLGAKTVCKNAVEWFTEQKEFGAHIDILSVSAGMENSLLTLKVLYRLYDDPKTLDLTDFFEKYQVLSREESDSIKEQGYFYIPEKLKAMQPTEAQKATRRNKYQEQQLYYDKSSLETPFLNALINNGNEKYVPSRDFNIMESPDIMYVTNGRFDNLDLITPKEDYIAVFREIIQTVNGVEKYNYIHALSDDDEEAKFMTFIRESEVEKYLDSRRLHEEDVPVLMEQLHTALFKLYIIQDLVDNEEITDIIISDYNDIRVRVRGDSYISDRSFIDRDDLERFISAICIRTKTKIDNPFQRFTYPFDDRFILRLSLASDYVNSEKGTDLHIRKIDKQKLLGKDLVELEYMPEIVKDYLIDCAKTKRGIVFAGPPGSGKTIALNWIIEEGYESTADILCIQETDELFSYRKGIRFQHVVTMPPRDQPVVTLEDLGKQALVEGANVFIIGEAKGAEMRDAITLSNSGCRTAMTLHSKSSTDTLDKMVDLAVKGDQSQTREEAKASLQAFQIIVYAERFKIREISEIIGYDNEKQDVIYKPIYRYVEPKKE